MLLQTEPPTRTAVLRTGYAQARRGGAVRHRDIAASLGVSEGALIAAHAQQQHNEAGSLEARALRGPWPELIASLERVGPVMALTRNAACVHEKTGVYRNASATGHVGLVLGGDIDLRLFYRQWAHGFAVDEMGAKGLQSSLQFFDARGTAVHKVFARDLTDRDAWAELVAGAVDEDATPSRSLTAIETAPADEAEVQTPDSQIDVAGLRQGWSALRDTHEFFGLMRRFGVQREQALRLAEARYAQRVEPDVVHGLLHAVSASGLPIMVFVSNGGAIQIHSGPVHKVVPTGPWLNVMDPGFNLHLRQDLVARAWIVRKPTVDGLVTSLELFDAQGETIAMLFGERKPGRAELCAWRQVIDTLAPGAFEGVQRCTC